MKRIGMVAALPGELKPLVRGWQRRGPVFVGRIGDSEIVAACAGMGADAVTRACEQVLASGSIDALASVGWAGSLSCGLKPPEAVAVREVIDARSGERFSTADAQGQRLITIDHVVAAPEKRSLAMQYQAALVDMEAAAVARCARVGNLPFLCFKAVSDGPNDNLPDFNLFTGADGQLRMPALVAWALLHPQYWAAFGRLGKNSRLAAEELAKLSTRCLLDWR
jgi:adenosylhomocysteine nucleosidase